jgi:hypothetical protein
MESSDIRSPAPYTAFMLRWCAEFRRMASSAVTPDQAVVLVNEKVADGRRKRRGK